MFGLFEAIFPLFFLFVFGIVVFVFVKSIVQWGKNNKSPRLTVDATVVDKHAQRHHHHHETHYHDTSSFHVTFQVESGDRMVLQVPANEFGYLVQGDRGKLTFQGTRFLSFQRQ